MATTYRFFKDGEVDVFLDTDASDFHKEFFVTDVRGLDPEEIRLAFEPMIRTYNEGELIQYSKDKSVNLYSFDQYRRERVLHVDGEPYGIFNGLSSFMEIDNIDIAESGNDEELDGIVTMSVDIRFDNAGLAQANTNLEFGFYSLFESINSGVSLTLTNAQNFIPDTSISLIISAYMFADNSEFELTKPFTFEPEVWYTLKAEFSNDSVTPSQNIRLFVNNDKINEGDLDEDLGVFSSDLYYVGSQGDEFSNFFPGGMRNLILSTQSGSNVIVDIKDPSTGTNDGTGENGTPTDITQALD